MWVKKLMGLELLFSLDPSIIIEFMDLLFAMVYQGAQNVMLQDWGNEVISNLADEAEKQVVDQLGYNPPDQLEP